MKKTFIFLLFSIIFSFSYGQNLALFDSEGSIPNGGSIEVIGNTDASIIYSYINLVNLTNSTSNIKVLRRTISTVSGSLNSFCWGQCYDATIDTSLRILPILAHDTSFDFAGEYEPHLHRGTTTVSYVFFNVNNPSDTISVTVNYTANVASGIISGTPSAIDIANAYPNPASGSTTIKYSLPKNNTNARLIIRDCLGILIMDEPLAGNTGKMSVDLNELREGIYFYSVIVNNTAICTRKLVVK